MPGNKAPRRERKGIKTNSVQSRNAAYVKALQQKAQLRAKLEKRNEKRNNLPLAHPMNCHMIRQTMGPLRHNIDEHERLGTVMVDGDGAPLFYDGANWINVIPAMLHMCFVFEKMAAARVWPKMPEGLRVYTLALQFGRKPDADDFAGARATLDWMEKHMGTLTPTKWTELFDWATSLEGGQIELGEASNG